MFGVAQKCLGFSRNFGHLDGPGLGPYCSNCHLKRLGRRGVGISPLEELNIWHGSTGVAQMSGRGCRMLGKVDFIC